MLCQDSAEHWFCFSFVMHHANLSNQAPHVTVKLASIVMHKQGLCNISVPAGSAVCSATKFQGGMPRTIGCAATCHSLSS